MLKTIYFIGVIPSLVLASGMMFSDLQSVWGTWREQAILTRRRDAIMSIIVGALFAFGWPIGLPVAFLISHGAEHGIWRSPHN